MDLTLHREGSYAVCVAARLTGLRAGDRRLSAAEIAQECNIPQAILRKTALHLARGGVIEGTRGCGYRLPPEGAPATLLDVIRPFDGACLERDGCFAKDGACPVSEVCPARALARRIRGDLRDGLAGIPVGALPLDARGIPHCFQATPEA
ncbi:MAG: Rrf2 family transcriptional regulator [Planctomycetes bacterium]|nr:Rrf2 family transcriptional regulator [Planctomycetota bacterium]